MGDYDSSPMLYCSGVLSHKIPFASKGLDYHSQQIFYQFIKRNNKEKKRGYDSSPLLQFARGHGILADSYRRLKIHFALVVAALSILIFILNKKHGAYNGHKTRTAVICFLFCQG